MTVAQLKELATEYGLTLTSTTKSNIIDEILHDLYPDTLSAMALGELELDPDFDADEDTYTAATTNAKDKRAVTATDANANATITVKLNDAAVTAGTDGKYELTWSEENDGVNVVTVKVANGYQGEVYETYTITVTKS